MDVTYILSEETTMDQKCSSLGVERDLIMPQKQFQGNQTSRDIWKKRSKHLFLMSFP